MFSPKRSIVLAGDAAHIHSVNGGQGLNTGIADAFALAWRLHLAVRGHPNALQSFENERLETARNVIDVAAKLVRSTVRTAKEYVGLIEQSAKYITGKWAVVSYRSISSCIISHRITSHHAAYARRLRHEQKKSNLSAVNSHSQR